MVQHPPPHQPLGGCKLCLHDESIINYVDDDNEDDVDDDNL